MVSTKRNDLGRPESPGVAGSRRESPGVAGRPSEQRTSEMVPLVWNYLQRGAQGPPPEPCTERADRSGAPDGVPSGRIEEAH